MAMGAFWQMVCSCFLFDILVCLESSHPHKDSYYYTLIFIYIYNMEDNNTMTDMGLGKTLQGITLLWTLLSNGHPELGGSPLARRVIICCPTSLVSNWDSECTKWLNVRNCFIAIFTSVCTHNSTANNNS